MKRKVLQDLANTVCQMFCGWRVGDDLESLSEAPSGEITVDLLTGAAVHDKVGQIELQISKEIQTWFEEQLDRNHIVIGDIRAAVLVVEMDTGTVKTDREWIVLFNWKCLARIETDEKIYRGKLLKKKQWHQRMQ